MPRRDGTGPQGQGPGTGRRRGRCFGAFTKKDGSLSVWRTLVIPALGALVNDLRKPDSISRRTLQAITERFKTKQLSKNSLRSEEIEGNYTVLDEEKGE